MGLTRDIHYRKTDHFHGFYKLRQKKCIFRHLDPTNRKYVNFGRLRTCSILTPELTLELI
jgi:hypothetical protein